MSGTARSKFIPILRKGDYEPGPECAIPTHFLGIAWIEFRDDAAFEESIEDLIRVILSKPRFALPPLGAQLPLETISATILNRVKPIETDQNRELPNSDEEKSDSVKTDLREAAITLRGHTKRVLSVAFSPDGRTLASGCDDKTVKLLEGAARE